MTPFVPGCDGAAVFLILLASPRLIFLELDLGPVEGLKDKHQRPLGGCGLGERTGAVDRKWNVPRPC